MYALTGRSNAVYGKGIEVSSPMLPFESADTSDDDGQVIDSFLIETDAPPNIETSMQPITIPAPVEIPRVTRILSGIMLIDPTWADGSLLLPPDAHRLEFAIIATTPAAATATDYVNVADEGSKVSSAKNGVTNAGAFRVRTGVLWDLDAHTGPIWVCGSSGQTQPIEVSYRAVTW